MALDYQFFLWFVIDSFAVGRLDVSHRLPSLRSCIFLLIGVCICLCLRTCLRLNFISLACPSTLSPSQQVNDPTIPGPFHLWPLRKALSNGPPCRLRRAPLTLLAYPDWRQWRPGGLATATATSTDLELDERDLIDEVMTNSY